MNSKEDPTGELFALVYKKERAASKFPFAGLEENEEDLAKPEAWYAKVRARDRSGASLAERPGVGGVQRGPWGFR